MKCALSAVAKAGQMMGKFGSGGAVSYRGMLFWDRYVCAVAHPGDQEMLKRIREASPCFKARVAGGLFLLVILTAAFTQFFVHGRLGFAAELSSGRHRDLEHDRGDAALL